MRMPARAVLALAVGLGTALAAGAAYACCMMPRSYAGTISQSLQEALIFHAEGREDLVLGIHYHITPKNAGADAALPASFAWIVTLPAEPDAYAIADAVVFREAFDLFERKRPRQPGPPATPPPAAGARPAEPGLEFGKRVQVGAYDIQPVRALGKEALGALNAWLDANGFPTEDEKHMAYFVENKFTFLCIKLSKQKDAAGVAMAGGLEPLHMSFKSEKIYYPLRFSSRQGVFDVMAHVFSDKPLDGKACEPYVKRLNADAWDAQANFKVERTEFQGKLAELSKKVKAGEGRPTWFMNRIHGIGFNQGPTAIANWPDDIFLAVK